MDKMKIGIWIAVFVFFCSTASAQYRRFSYRVRPVAAVVVKPAVTVHVSNRFTLQERLAMAVAYLDCNRFISVKKYARITGLTKEMAEAELDAFSRDRRKPIVTVMNGKKKMYTLKG